LSDFIESDFIESDFIVSDFMVSDFVESDFMVSVVLGDVPDVEGLVLLCANAVVATIAAATVRVRALFHVVICVLLRCSVGLRPG
jgi:hypothetical protein